MNTSKNQLRFLCFGAGAIGTYIGASLLSCGQKVTFIEQPVIAENLKRQGIRLQDGSATYTFSNPEIATCVEEALTNGPYDLGILAVKSFDTQSIAEGLKPYQAALPPILSLQNGVENEATLEVVLGKGKIIPASVTTAIGRNRPGDVFVERKRGIAIASQHILIPTLLDILRCANLNPKLCANPAGMKWSKMITNLLANASSAILDMPPAQIFAHPGLYHIEVLQIRETLEIMAKMSIPVVDLPSTPVRLLCASMSILPERISQLLLEKSVGKGRGEKMPSFHIDLHHGRGKSEVDYLNGSVVRFSSQFGLNAPVNQFLCETLTHLTDKSIPLATYAGNPDHFISEISKRLG